MNDNGSGAVQKPPTKLLAKLHNVMSSIGVVPKKGRNKFHGYDYATEADVLLAIRKHLIEQKLMILASGSVTATELQGDSTLTTVGVTYDIYDVDSGESIRCSFDGHGSDKGDKGVYKGYTGANKYFLLKTFQMPTGDDPENDNGSSSSPTPARKSKYPTPEQKDEIKRLVKERDVPDSAIKNIKEQMGYGGGALYETAQAFILQLRQCPMKGESASVS